MSVAIADSPIKVLQPPYAGTIMHRVQVGGSHVCEVGCLARANADDERLLLRVAPGHFCIIVPMNGGTVLNAWCNRSPETLDTVRHVLHAFDLRYAWSLQRHFPRGALIIQAPCEIIAGWCGTQRPVAHAAARYDNAVLTIVSELSQAVAGLLGYRGPEPSRVLEHLVQAILGNLRMGLCECAVHPRPSKDRFAVWQEQRVRNYIAANLTNKIRLTDVSRSCGMSCSHFSRLFKNTIGVTLHQWVIEQRIAEAQRLLRDTSTAIAEIATATGFADQAHFSRVFSKTTRTTPMAWRRVSQA